MMMTGIIEEDAITMKTMTMKMTEEEKEDMMMMIMMIEE